MKTLIITSALICLVEFSTRAQIETNLLNEIKVWKKGEAPPSRLLKFPDGKIDLFPECGLGVIGSWVDYYIGQINDNTCRNYFA